MTRSTSDGASPEAASAFAPAASAMSATVSSSRATRRDWMPTRDLIHSSLVSTIFARSSLVTTLAGWYPPKARIFAPATIRTPSFTRRADAGACSLACAATMARAASSWRAS